MADPGMTLRMDLTELDLFGKQLRTIVETLKQAGLEDTAETVQAQAKKMLLTGSIAWEEPHA